MRFETLREAVLALMERTPERVRHDLLSDDDALRLSAEMELMAMLQVGSEVEVHP